MVDHIGEIAIRLGGSRFYEKFGELCSQKAEKYQIYRSDEESVYRVKTIVLTLDSLDNYILSPSSEKEIKILAGGGDALNLQRLTPEFVLEEENRWTPHHLLLAYLSLKKGELLKNQEQDYKSYKGDVTVRKFIDVLF